MNEGETIKFRYIGILEKALITFFNQQNKKISGAFSAEYEQFKKNLAQIIAADAPRAERILKSIYTGLYRDYGAWQFKQLNGTLTGFNPTTLEIIQTINNTAREQAQIIQDSTKKIIEKVAKKALYKGLTIQETTKILREKINGIAKYRAVRIARFECISGANKASMEGASQVSGKVKKFWVYTHDKRTRPTHRNAGQKYNRDNAIDLDKKFKVGRTELLYPADRQGDKKEIFNCRCTIGYVRRSNQDAEKKS